ncbi:helix-turn-helix domain-containing protein [Aerosakkonemataceae cyanobacterium BLCC-F50]|uniref:Helix-turn-helix domain-containing protein n=1 Tax=Floridaenema flaviceps BLCC-F50 TaxID=3153642 RepID=A0ABV4XJU5_9CYAN
MSDVLQHLDSLIPDNEETRQVELSEILKHARISAKLTQKQLADKLGVSQSWVAKIENQTHQSSFDDVSQFLKACGASIQIKFSDGIDYRF